MKKPKGIVRTRKGNWTQKQKTSNPVAQAITEQSLRDFLQDKEAPEGCVYFWEGEPFAQIHLFEGEYTFFWLGSAEGAKLADSFLELANYDVSSLIDRGSKKNRECEFRVRCFYESEIGGEPKCRNAELILKQLPPGSHLMESLNRFVEGYKYRSRAHYFSAQFAPNARWRITLWGDTGRGAAERNELGLTSNLLIEPVVLRNLFMSTSTVSVHKEEIDRLLKGDVYQKSLRYFDKS
jgi:hypothetical protein